MEGVTFSLITSGCRLQDNDYDYEKMPGAGRIVIFGDPSDVSNEKRVQLDMMNYIRNISVWSVLHIHMQTVPALIRGRGAY